MHLYFGDLAIYCCFAYAYLVFPIHFRMDLIVAMHGASKHAMYFTRMVARICAYNEITFLTSLQILLPTFLQFLFINEATDNAHFIFSFLLS